MFEKYNDHQILEYEDHHINIYDDKVYDHMTKSLYWVEMEENGVNYGAGKACTGLGMRPNPLSLQMPRPC